MIRRMGWILAFVLTVDMAVGDTFIPKSGGSALHGYLTSQTEGAKTIVVTQEQGQLSVNLSDYKIQPDSQGRKPHVAVISIPGVIELEMETAAFEKAVVEEADRGPLCIVVEIDSPGGRVDLVKRMCSALSSAKYCPTVAYVRGGKHGGAYSGGAVVAMACPKLYMAKDTAIGAASMILHTDKSGPMDLKKVLGEEVGEKMNSAWRNYVGSLAELNNRPGLLAKAMVDKDIAVVEVEHNGKRQFVEPFNQQTGDKVVKTWSRKGSILTLTAMEAVQCGIADGTAASRNELLSAMKVASAAIQENGRMAEARKQFEDILKRFKKINDSLDLRVQQLGTFARTVPRAQVLKTYQGVLQDIRALIRMGQICPDLPYSQEDLQAALNAVQAQYDALRMAR
jgi:ATP-dependent protease ClpP protease subunit